MEKETVLAEMVDIMKDVFETDDLSLSYDTIASDIEEWDSLNHIQLVVAIEKHFKLKFSSAEIQQWKNVGEICDSIVAKA